jgi:hypothetical protein
MSGRRSLPGMRLACPITSPRYTSQEPAPLPGIRSPSIPSTGRSPSSDRRLTTRPPLLVSATATHAGKHALQLTAVGRRPFGLLAHMAPPTKYQASANSPRMHEHGRPGGATTFDGNTNPVVSASTLDSSNQLPLLSPASQGAACYSWRPLKRLQATMLCIRPRSR